MKIAFFNAKGFINFININSRGDDVLRQDFVNNEKAVVCGSQDRYPVHALTISFTKMFRQKKRHISAAHHCKIQHPLLVSSCFISNILLFLFAAILFLFYPWQDVLPNILSFSVFQYLIFRFSEKKLQEPQIIYFLPFSKISLLMFQFSIFINNLISKTKH
jgi:hypothetical protein